MGTEVKVTLWASDAEQGQQAINDVMTEMRRIDQTFSPYIETSELARVNQFAAQHPVTVSPELAKLLQRSLYYSDLSQGAFDITFASVGWFYDYRQHQQPTTEQKKQLLSAINYHNLQFDAQKSTLRFSNENVRIDLGGIAKGYAVDRAVEILQKRGIKHATVSAGGDSRLLGDKRGRPWLIGIKNPRPSETQPQDVVLTMPLDDVAVSTSGDYERFFIDEKTGQRVHHIMNPKTGDSARELMSVTILGPQGMDTDALSTTVFVLGTQRGIDLINQLPQFDCVVIAADGKVHYSQGLMPPTQ